MNNSIHVTSLDIHKQILNTKNCFIMADIRIIAEELVNLTVQETAELANVMKEEYGIDPAVKFSVDFEEAGMSFGGAVQCLKRGQKVARKGWNGKGMWLWLKPGTMVKSEWCHDPALKAIADDNGGEIEALGTICLKTADNKILSGWLASQTDVLSTDWVVVD